MRYYVFSAVALLFIPTILVGCDQPSVTVADPVAESTSDSSAAAVEATAVSFANAKCPIMGGKPTVELITEYDGKTIGFCCEGCPEKWSELDDETKVETFAKVRVEE